MRVAGLIAGLACLLLLVACGSTGKKEYAKLEPVADKVDIKALWVVKSGVKSELEHRQLSVDVTPERVYASDAKGHVIVLNQQDGEIIWKKSFKMTVSSGPKFDSGVLYLGNEANLYALNAETGDIQWKTRLSSEILSEPVLSGDRLFVQTIDGKLFALNRKNGEKIWVDSREVPALTLRGTSSPVITKQRVIAGFANGKLVAYDIETGNRLWEVTVAVSSGRTDLQRMVDIDGLLQADNNEVYVVSYQGRIAAISMDNGQTIWSREMSSYSGITLDGKQLYVTDANGQVWAIDRGSGATLWRQDTLEDRDVTGPVVLGDAVVVADGAGWVHWLSKEDGAFIGRKNLAEVYGRAFHNFGDEDRSEYDYGVSSELKVANDKIYVRNNVGALCAFQLSSVQHTN